MLRRSHILTAVAVLAMCVVPGFAYGMPDQPAPPPSSSAAAETDQYQDLRSPDARDAKTEPVPQVTQDLRSPDARDAGRPEAPTPDTVVEIREPQGSGFDWGDAGIGAAGILAMLSIAGGLALMVTSRRRRRGTEMPAH
jgi:hypothetical protein